jgi:hypothetical protein
MTGGKTVEIARGPHNVCWSHANEVNSALLSFLGRKAGDRSGTGGSRPDVS